MLKQLKIEWMKIKNYNAFWWISIMFLIGIVGANYVVYYISGKALEQTGGNANAEMGKQVIKAMVGSPYAFPDVWRVVSYVASYLLFFPGIVVITNITNEINFKTHRQNIIDGWSRMQFVTVKIVMVAILAAIASLVVFLTALIFGSMSGASFSLTNIQYVGYFFIQMLAYGLVAIVFSVLLKRSGLAIGLFFIYYIFEKILWGVIRSYGYTFGYFLPLQSAENLNTNPWFANFNPFAVPSETILLVFALGYIVAYYFIITYKYKTDDL
jgi:ABC-2 type transport system permease protein